MDAVKIPYKKQITPKRYYIELAIAGTGQEGIKDINIFKICTYLQKHAERIVGNKWDIWLESLDLGTTKQVSEAIRECCI